MIYCYIRKIIFNEVCKLYVRFFCCKSFITNCVMMFSEYSLRKNEVYTLKNKHICQFQCKRLIKQDNNITHIHTQKKKLYCYQ